MPPFNTAGLDTASVLARCLSTWSGTVLVIGQPAEETLTGARAMLADGLYWRSGTAALGFLTRS